MKLKLFILVLTLQSAWILGTAVTQERTLHVGQIILLEAQPVDPRDFLQGDYLRLNYKISDVPREKFFAPPLTNDLRPDTSVFVAVAPVATNQFCLVTRASTLLFPTAANEVLLRGKTAESWRNNPSSVHVEYGIEKYFVAEDTGNPHGKLTVQAAVAKSGQPSIKEVFVDGKPYVEALKP